MQTENDPEITKKPKKKRRKDRVRVLLFSLLGLLSLLLTLQLLFFYYSDALFGRVLKEVVYQQSNKVYRIQYDKIQFNVFVNELELIDVKLISDSIAFDSHRKKANNANKVIDVSSPRLRIQGPSLFKLYFQEVLNINEFTFEDPEITIKSYGALTGNLSAFKNFHKVISKYLEEFMVKELKVVSANIKVINYQNNRASFKLNDISASIENLEIKREQLEVDTAFKLSDIGIQIQANSFALDSNTQLSFEQLDFSVKDSIIAIKNLRVKQQQQQQQLTNISFDLEEFELLGTDFYNFYFNDIFKARTANLNIAKVNYTEFKKGDPLKLYNIIKPFFKQIAIKETNLNNFSIHFQRKYGVKRNLQIPLQWARMEDISFDSATYLERKPRFFADQMTARLNNFSLSSKDSIHNINAEILEVSTQRKELLAFGLSIQSNKDLAKKVSNKNQPKTTVDGTIANVQLLGLNPWQLINDNILISRALLLSELELKLHKLDDDKVKKNYDQTVLKRNLLRQFNEFAIENIEVQEADITYLKEGRKNFESKGASFYANNFVLNTSTITNKQLLFSTFFNTSCNSLNVYMPDGVHIMQVKKLKWLAKEGAFMANNLILSPSNKISDSVLALQPRVSNIYFDQVSTKGFKLDDFLYDNRLDVDIIDIKGNNSFSVIKNMVANKARHLPIVSARIGEFHMDSLTADFKKNGSLSMSIQQNGAVIQVCDMLWDTSYPKASFDAYAVNVNGKKFAFYSEKMNHSIKAKSLEWSTNNARAEFKDLAIKPIKRDKTELYFNTSRLRLDSLDIPRLLKDKWLEADFCVVDKPAIRFKAWSSQNDSVRQYKYQNPYPFINSFLNGMHLSNVRLNDGNAYVSQVDSAKITTFEALDFNTYLNHLYIDSNTVLTDTNFLFSASSDIYIANFKQYATDSTLLMQAQDMRINPHEKKLVAEKFLVHNFKKPKSLDYFEFSTQQIHVDGLDYNKFLIKRDLIANKIDLNSPNLKLGFKEETKITKEELFSREIPNKLVQKISRIQIQKIAFQQASLDILYLDNKKLKTEKIPNWKGYFDSFNISKDQTEYDFLYSKNFHAGLYNYKRRLSDSLNILGVDSIIFDLAKQQLNTSGVAIIPRYSKELYGIKKGEQTDRVELYNQASQVHGFNLKELLYHGRFRADSIVTDSTYINAYRDKRDSLGIVAPKPMPQEWLREQVELKIKVGLIHLREWNITYEEKIPDAIQAGLINFNHFNARINGLSNFSEDIEANDTIKVKLNTKLMHTGQLTANLDIPLKCEDEAFYFNGYLNKMDLKEVNPMLENLAFLRISDGVTNELRFDGVADRYVAQGNMYFYYSNLKVALIDKETGETKGFVQKLGSFIANSVVISSKNSKLFFPRTGDIFYERNPDKSIFSFGAKALISGIKNSIGIQKRQQKKDKKAYKERMGGID